jgi:hypothetical protein
MHILFYALRGWPHPLTPHTTPTPRTTTAAHATVREPY